MNPLFAVAPLLAPAPGPVQWEAQAMLAETPAWEAFRAGEGAGWRARFDEGTGLPWRAWGPPVPLEPRDDVVLAARAFLARHADLVGVPVGTLVPRRAGTSGGITYLRFDQVLPDGTPVRDAGVELRIRDGRLVLLGVETSPIAATVDTTAARPWSSGDLTKTSAVLVVLREGRLAWEITGRRPGDPADLTRWVDARDGTTLGERSHTCALAGQLAVEHDDRTPDGVLVTSPLAGATVTTDLGAAQTGEDGTYDVPGTTGRVTLANGAFTVLPTVGDAGGLSLTGGAETFAAPSATQAELDTWVWLTIASSWGETYGPDVPMPPIVARLGTEPPCFPSAQFDGAELHLSGPGDLNGAECVDPARIEDIGVHEWGHIFHHASLLTGFYQGDIGEGSADLIAALNTGDSVVAPGFFLNGTALRDLDNGYRYPDDVSSDDHFTGLIYAGAVWDLWQGFAAEEGETAARDRTSRLLAGALRGGPGLLDAWLEFALADDDDGDLSNGTPNECAILAAFDAHGIGPSAGTGAARLVHDPVAEAEDGLDIAIVAGVQNLAPTCLDVEVMGATVHWRVDPSGSWQSVSADVGGDGITATIPGQPAGTVVEYWIEADLADGTTADAPASGGLAPYAMVVGPLELVRCDDFEADDGGYEASNGQGAPEDGWAWGEPSGRGGDPSAAWSGARAWGTDLAGDGMYGVDGDAALASRPFALPEGTRGILQFRRWLAVEDGAFDQARVTANGEVVWSNPSSLQGEYPIADRAWAPYALALPDDGSASVVVGWELASDALGQAGGWTVDDVCLWAAPSARQDTDVEPRACGCASAGAPIWPFAGLALVVRRRQPPRAVIAAASVRSTPSR